MIVLVMGIGAFFFGIWCWYMSRGDRDLSRKSGMDLYGAGLAVGGGYLFPPMGLLLIIVGLLSMR